MNQEKFRSLCEQTCIALGLPDIGQLEKEEKIIVDEIEVSIVYDEFCSPDYLMCCVDVGYVNEARRPEILEALLMLNLFSQTKTTGAYALDPLGQRAVFVVMLSFTESLDGRQLADTLKIYANRSKQLKDMLLADDPAAPDFHDEPEGPAEEKFFSRLFAQLA